MSSAPVATPTAAPARVTMEVSLAERNLLLRIRSLQGEVDEILLNLRDWTITKLIQFRCEKLLPPKK